MLTGAVDKAKNAGKQYTLWVCSPQRRTQPRRSHHGEVELAAERGAEKIYLHAFLDGRDTPPRSAESSLKKFEENLLRWVKAA